MSCIMTEENHKNFSCSFIGELATEEEKENTCPVCGTVLYLETCGIPPDDLYDVFICLNCFWSEKLGEPALEEELYSIPF